MYWKIIAPGWKAKVEMSYKINVSWIIIECLQSLERRVCHQLTYSSVPVRTTRASQFCRNFAVSVFFVLGSFLSNIITRKFSEKKVRLYKGQEWRFFTKKENWKRLIHATLNVNPPPPGNALYRTGAFTRYKWIQRFRISLKCLPLSKICTEYEISVWWEERTKLREISHTSISQYGQ